MHGAALKGNPLHAIPGCLCTDTQDPKWPGSASTPSTAEGQGGLQGPYPAHRGDFFFSHLNALVGYFSRCWPICGITEVTNLVSKEKGLISAQAVGAVPCIRSPPSHAVTATNRSCPADGCPREVWG